MNSRNIVKRTDFTNYKKDVSRIPTKKLLLSIRNLIKCPLSCSRHKKWRQRVKNCTKYNKKWVISLIWSIFSQKKTGCFEIMHTM